MHNVMQSVKNIVMQFFKTIYKFTSFMTIGFFQYHLSVDFFQDH